MDGSKAEEAALLKEFGDKAFKSYMKELTAADSMNFPFLAPCFKCGKGNGKEARYGHGHGRWHLIGHFFCDSLETVNNIKQHA